MKAAVMFENGDPEVLRYEDVPDRGSVRLSGEQGSTTPVAPEVSVLRSYRALNLVGCVLRVPASPDAVELLGCSDTLRNHGKRFRRLGVSNAHQIR
jgi:hypothetical protein